MKNVSSFDVVVLENQQTVSFRLIDPFFLVFQWYKIKNCSIIYEKKRFVIENLSTKYFY